MQDIITDTTTTTTKIKKAGRPKGAKNKVPVPHKDDPCSLFSLRARLKELKRIATTATSEQARVNAINAVTRLLNDSLIKNEGYKITTIIFEDIDNNIIDHPVDIKKNIDIPATEQVIKEAQIVGKVEEAPVLASNTAPIEVVKDVNLVDLELDIGINKEPEEDLFE